MTKTLKNAMTSITTAGVMAMTYGQSVFAQDGVDNFGGTPDIGGLPDATSPDDVRNVIVTILEAVLNFLALIAVIVIIIAGIRLIVSQGDEDQAGKAKKTIFYAIAGLVVVLLARVIVSIITVYLQGEISS